MKLARTLKISEVSPQGRDALQISLTAEDGGAPDLPFKPGQYLTIAAEVGGAEHWRSYSITSEPKDLGSISVLVRRVAGGRVSNWICDNAEAGERVRVLPPAGRFTLARAAEPALLLAGGSGIAPILSLARQALAEGAPRVGVFYANRDRDTLMLAEHLRELEVIADGRLQIKFWFDSEDGLPTANDFRAVTAGFERADAYLCGPEPFMQGACAALSSNGYNAERIYQESFADSDNAKLGSGRAGRLTVKLRGQIHEVDVRPGQPLLSAMLEAGLQIPHSCKVGECASCMCRLIDGNVEMLGNSVLDEEDLSNGWILACSSRATTDHLAVNFS